MPLRNGYQFFSYGVAMLACALLTSPLMTESANSQTVIYDGSQALNFFSSSFLTDDLAIAQVQQAGADLGVLEVGDAAWLRSSGRRMRTIDPADEIGLASVANGVSAVSGGFFSANPTANNPDPANASDRDARGTGAAYVLNDSNVTTGLQTLNFSLYYNDAVPNLVEDVGNTPAPNTTGGNVAVRVYGIRNSTDANNPWADDDFQLLAGNGSGGAIISSARVRDMDSGGPEPEIDLLAVLDSSSTVNPTLTSSADWQDITLPFQAGTGYDWFIFGFSGAEQDDTNLPADRFGFGNISFVDAPIIDGDYNEDGVVDAADFVVWRDGDSDDPSIAGYNLWVANYGNSLTSSSAASASATATSVPEPGSVLLIALGVTLLAQARNQRKS